MTPSTTHVVRISFANGKPVATPASITVKPGDDIDFDVTGGITAFDLDFREPPGPTPQEWFPSNQGKVKLKIRDVDRKKYKAGSPPTDWKRIKYDVIVDGVRLDP